MNVNIRKGERKIVLLKRERQVLRDAEELLVELSRIGGDAAQSAEKAANAIEETRDYLDGKLPVEAPY